jgi:hypothetical protein
LIPFENLVAFISRVVWNQALVVNVLFAQKIINRVLADKDFNRLPELGHILKVCHPLQLTNHPLAKTGRSDFLNAFEFELDNL